MDNFLLIRTVLNLCLIAATVIQPLAVRLVHGQDRPAGCHQAESACDGCGCCHVDQETKRCGCCRDAAALDASCCGEPHAEHVGADLPRTDALFGEISGVVPTPSADSGNDPAGDPTGDATFDNAGQINACLCGLDSEPAVPCTPRTPVDRLRETTVSACLADCDLKGFVCAGPLSFDLMRMASSESPRLFQQSLCVWRL